MVKVQQWLRGSLDIWKIRGAQFLLSLYKEDWCGSTYITVGMVFFKLTSRWRFADHSLFTRNELHFCSSPCNSNFLRGWRFGLTVGSLNFRAISQNGFSLPFPFSNPLIYSISAIYFTITIFLCETLSSIQIQPHTSGLSLWTSNCCMSFSWLPFVVILG